MHLSRVGCEVGGGGGVGRGSRLQSNIDLQYSLYSITLIQKRRRETRLDNHRTNSLFLSTRPLLRPPDDHLPLSSTSIGLHAGTLAPGGGGKPLRQAVKLGSVLLWRHCGFCYHCYSEQDTTSIPCNSTSQDYKARRCSLAGAAADETSGVMYGMLQWSSRDDAPIGVSTDRPKLVNGLQQRG